MNPSHTPIRARKKALREAGQTIQALANEAGVSWRMAKYWMDGEKTSAPIQAAFDRLTTREQAS